MATLIGKVGIVMKGTWSSSATYEQLDAVAYNAQTYIAKQSVPANTVPTNTTYWQPALTLSNETYDMSNITLEYTGTVTANPSYTLDPSSSIRRSGTTVTVFIVFDITSTGSGTKLRLKNLPVIPGQYRVMGSAQGSAIRACGGVYINGYENDAIIHNANGADMNSADIQAGKLFIGATFSI